MKLSSRNNSTLNAAIFVVFLLLSCNNKFLRKSATPPSELSSSDKLKYMVETGEQDRRSNILRYFLSPGEKKIKKVIQRDSLRCAYFLALEKEYKPVTGDDKWNAGLLMLHGDGNLNCRDTTLLIKSMAYFRDIKDNGPTIGDKKNGEIWFPQSVKSYTYLSTECAKRKAKKR